MGVRTNKCATHCCWFLLLTTICTPRIYYILIHYVQYTIYISIAPIWGGGLTNVLHTSFGYNLHSYALLDVNILFTMYYIYQLSPYGRADQCATHFCWLQFALPCYARCQYIIYNTLYHYILQYQCPQYWSNVNLPFWIVWKWLGVTFERIQKAEIIWSYNQTRTRSRICFGFNKSQQWTQTRARITCLDNNVFILKLKRI